MALELEDPEIVTLDEFMIAGLAHRGPPDDDYETLWTDFDDRISEFDGLRKTGEYFGVIYEYDQGGEEFTYVAGVPVEDTDDLSPKLTVVDIPESTYAVFDASATAGPDFLSAITDDWADQSGYEHVGGPIFEHYGAGYDPMDRTSGYELYVPIEGEHVDDAERRDGF